MLKMSVKWPKNSIEMKKYGFVIGSVWRSDKTALAHGIMFQLNHSNNIMK